MKRAAVILAMTLTTPGVVMAQAKPPVPTPTPAPSPPVLAPSTGSAPGTGTPAAPGSAPPAAAADTVPTEAPVGAPSVGPAPAAPAPAAPAPAAPAPAAPAPAAPAPAAPPGDQYYVEPPAPAGAARRQPPRTFEPPPPGRMIYEPPPPPEPRHLAPKTALWAGLRIGWLFPFGNLWANGRSVGQFAVLEGQPWSDFASSGPMFELDIGARIARHYTVFALWERAQLGSGDSNIEGAQDGGDSDFWGVGLRASSNPDHVGFLTEVAIGYRRARTLFESGVEYQYTDAPLEARLGIGADIRLSRTLTLSPMATVGVGSFGTLERVDPNGRVTSLTQGFDENDGHGWATLTVGAHFDLVPSRN